MREVFHLIARVAETTDPVLVSGETGTGKELVARAIHRRSARVRAPFVDINCAAIPVGLFESELFGHERGAFTDAREAKPGKFEVAHRGTLFLDEIDELPMEAQAKLLRVLETRQVTRLGSVRSIDVDVRLLAATNADLEGLAARGTFRRDLFYRLNVVTINLLPLRLRREDLGVLVDYFLTRLHHERGVEFTLTADAREALLRHDWPGNVRELDHRLRQAAACAAGTTLDVGDLRFAPSGAGKTDAASAELLAGLSLPVAGARVLAEFEVRHIRAALDRHGGNQTAAARALGIDRRTLYSKMREYDIAG
jgi:two-component system response regulator AtoC